MGVAICNAYPSMGFKILRCPSNYTCSVAGHGCKTKSHGTRYEQIRTKHAVHQPERLAVASRTLLICWGGRGDTGSTDTDTARCYRATKQQTGTHSFCRPQIGFPLLVRRVLISKMPWRNPEAKASPAPVGSTGSTTTAPCVANTFPPCRAAAPSLPLVTNHPECGAFGFKELCAACNSSSSFVRSVPVMCCVSKSFIMRKSNKGSISMRPLSQFPLASCCGTKEIVVVHVPPPNNCRWFQRASSFATSWPFHKPGMLK